MIRKRYGEEDRWISSTNGRPGEDIQYDGEAHVHLIKVNRKNQIQSKQRETSRQIKRIIVRTTLHIQVPVSKTDTHLVIKWSVRLSRNQCSFCESRKFIEEMKLSVFDGARPCGSIFHAKRCFRVGRYTEDHIFEFKREGIELVF